jgi:uncharacterized protein
MGKSGEFIVRFSGLGIGKHQFEFLADDRFFEQLENSLITRGAVNIKMEMDKKSTHLGLFFTLEGSVGEVCDRCSVEYSQPVQGEFKMFVKFGDAYEDVDDELIIIPRGDHELDVSQMVYEFIGLSIPLRKVPCEVLNDTTMCDQAVLDRISGEALDTEEQDNSTSPFKDILGGLKDRMN